MSGLLKGSHHTSLYTVSNSDLYDFFRCPKIVSIKVYKAMKGIGKTKKVVRKVVDDELTPQIIGQIGEIATNTTFSLDVDEDDVEESVIIELQKRGINVNLEVKKLLKNSLSGLKQIKPKLVEHYGDIQIIGKGETRYGLAPTYGMPDYVAYASKVNKPILIEVKNSEKKNIRDEFQASFYNTLQNQVGVLIKNERYEGKKFEIKPTSIFEKNAETAVLYPRLGLFDYVDETLPITNEVISGVWEAKQLGLIGKSPPCTSGPKCPHHKLGVELNEGSLEPGKPLSLVYSKLAIEKGVDLDFLYQLNYYWNKMPNLMTEASRMTYNPIKGEEDKIVKQFSKTLNMHEDSAKQLLFSEWPDYPSSEKILKEMSNEIEPWTKLIGKRKAKDLASNSRGTSTRIYSTPQSSDKLIEEAWSKWKSL